MRNARLLIGLLAVPLLAAPLAQGERDYALSQLHATRKMVMDAINGLSEAQWKFKPAPDRWSISEIVEHIILSEEGMMDWSKKVLETPAVPDRKPNRGADAKFYASWVDRTQKAQAPEQLRPGAGKWPAPAPAAKEFGARRDRTLEYVRTTQDDLRSHVTKSGDEEMDAYLVLLGIAAHTERHVAQIAEVKAAAGFPAK